MGESIEEALFLMSYYVAACEIQVRLMPVGIENIQLLSDEAIKQVRSIIKSAGVQVQGKPGDESGDKEQQQKPTDESKARKWKLWDLEFEARMRMLDNAVSACFSSLPTCFPSHLISPSPGLPHRLPVQAAAAAKRPAA